MRIFFPIGSFYPAQSGGPSNTIYWLAKALVKKGIKTTVLSTNLDIKKDNVVLNKWHDLEGIEVKYKNTNKLSFIIEAFKKSRSADIIHLTSLFEITSLPIVFLLLFTKKRIIWSARGELETFALNHKRSVLKKALLLIIKCLKSRIYFHSTSDSETANIVSIFGVSAKTIQVPNYLQLPIKRSNVLVKKEFLFIGRLHPIKSIDKLIKAFSMSNACQKNNFTLKIAGVGPKVYTNQLKKLVSTLNLQNRVIFTDKRIEGDAKENLYASSYASFLVSESENFGAVVVESMAQGTPVVTSKGTPWSLLNKNKTGYWIDNTPQTIAHTMDKIANLSEDEYLNLRQNALKTVVVNFDINKKIETWIKLYNQVLA